MSRPSRILLASVLALIGERAASGTTQFSGECSYSSFDQNGKSERRTTRAFTATIDGCRWRIRTAQAGTNGPHWSDSVYAYMEQANGADSLFVTRVFDVAKLAASDSPIVEKSVTVSWGTTPCVDPEQFTAAIVFPFLFECDGGTVTNGRMKNLFSMNESLVRDDITFPFSVRYLSNSSPPVIQELLLRNEGFAHVHSPDGKVGRKAYKAPYAAGFVESSFTVLEFTNFAGLTIPRRSQIKYFRTKAGAIINTETVQSAQLDIVTKTVIVTNAFLAVPELVDPPAMIYDKRLKPMGSETFEYLTKGVIYETNAPEIQRIYHESERRRALIRSSKDPKR